MKNSTILRVVILGVIAIGGIIAMQSYWVVSTWNLHEEEFSKKVNLALFNVARSLADVNQSKLPPRNVVNQRSTNYYVVNIEYEIDPNLLEYFLQKEFESLALNVDFEYAVFNCTTDEMEYGKYISYAPHVSPGRLELGNLPRYDEFTYYFGVKFPTRSGYLFSKMQLSIFFSLLLFLTLLFFSYSMYVILRQKRLSEMQKDFINNMTHEFKTPLSTIKISADVFLQHPDVRENPRLFQYATIIREQNQRLNQQVEKVLQLARVERDSFDIKRERLNLRDLLEHVLASVRLRIEKQGGDLQVDLEGADRVIQADPLHLTNIIHNLLDNAEKYCRESPRIRVWTEARANHLLLHVRDNGIGISPEYRHRVFDKFFRVPTGNVHDVKGFGLGLYYVRKVCEAHGWSIRLDSYPGRGTTAVITMKTGKP